MAAPTTTTQPGTVERLDRIEARLDDLTALLAAQQHQREAWTELAHDAGEIAGPAMTALTERLGVLEERGHLGFVRAGWGVADRVMTAFDEQDVEALGDNIVLILQTVREMTQPEVMGLLQRTAGSVGAPADPSAPPPTVLALLRDLRDPEVRRGLGRLLQMLRSMGRSDAAPTGAG